MARANRFGAQAVAALEGEKKPMVSPGLSPGGLSKVMDAALPYEMNAAGRCDPGARLHPTAAFERPARAKNRTHSARFCLEKLNDFRYTHTKTEQ
ncbi:hypothetical protein KAM369_10990 [Aeromonas caviae]|nr:hypothetical protein KAM359_11030 [Aeromonas caviae]GJB23316.1 hypothetical protein KAM365_10660 [Aeromonas caviae]GJB31665.1 hypothetical protein KAM367_07670 [Aeromonas caviae]GJB40624.1 hypothetical protein KAM369_10990 [Aeromonas caviae]GJB45216.1 hypothetical protein KAM370_11580 [Aeromonas caviae]